MKKSVKKRVSKSASKTKSSSSERDQFMIVLEGIRDDFKVFGEMLNIHVEQSNSRFDNIEKIQSSHTEMLGQLLVDMSEVKGELKNKVDRDEFMKLELRVINLERKVRV